jgi:Co/Zn/Cd efflux system component
MQAGEQIGRVAKWLAYLSGAIALVLLAMLGMRGAMNWIDRLPAPLSIVAALLFLASILALAVMLINAWELYQSERQRQGRRGRARANEEC